MGDAVFREIGFYLPPRHAEERADYLAAHGRYAAKSRAAGSAREIEEHRLGVVARVMRGGDPVTAETRRRAAQKIVAQLARGLLGAHAVYCGESVHVPVLHGKLYAVFAAEILDKAAVAQRFLPAQAVLKMRGTYRDIQALRLRIQPVQQAHRVRPAGDGAQDFAALRQHIIFFDQLSIHHRAASRPNRSSCTPAARTAPPYRSSLCGFSALSPRPDSDFHIPYYNTRRGKDL